MRGNQWLTMLVCVRLGQELGHDSPLARAVAAVVTALLALVNG